MKVTKIMAAMPMAAAMSNSAKSQMSNPISAGKVQPQILSQNDSKASQVISNYFKASQAIPSFKGHPCATSNFRPKELESMPCACCGRPMMTNAQIDRFIDETANKTGKDLAVSLMKHIDFFRAGERAVVQYFIGEAQKNPNQTMNAMLQRLCGTAEKLERDQQKDVLARMSEMAKTELGTDKNPIENCVQRGLSSIDKNSRKPAFNRNQFIADLMKSTSKMENQEVANKAIDIAVQLPSSSKSINSFIVKYSAKSNEDIARRLVSSSIVTAEHIHPKSLGGPNHTANYVGECQECNSSRGNMSLEEWMKNYPNMPRSFQKNVDAVTEQIIQGKIGGNYDDWAVDVKSAIERETNGVIRLTVKNPEEIDKIREEKGLAKPEKSQKELDGAAGAYQGAYHGKGNKTASAKKSETKVEDKVSEKVKKPNGKKRPKKFTNDVRVLVK